MIDKMLMFDDNKLGTVNTTFEFMLVGTIAWLTVPSPSVFFIVTGAFYPTNNTFDIFQQKYFNESLNSAFGDNYRYNQTNMGSDPIIYYD